MILFVDGSTCRFMRTKLRRVFAMNYGKDNEELVLNGYKTLEENEKEAGED